MLVNISVYSGHIAEGFREQPPLASALTERWYMAPGVRRIDIREKGVRGTLFIPPGPGPFPGLMDMWGIGGGLIERRSALLASHGYVSLALEYFSPGELKSAELEFKYFEAAFNIVKDHPQVIPDRVGIFGISLGATFTMYLAAESTIIKVAQMMHTAGKDHLLTRLHYPDTGHVIEPPYSPHFRATNFIIESTKAKGEFYLHTRRQLSTMSQTIPPILSVLPTRALVDEKFKVLVENLPAGSPVTVHSLHHSEDKDYWEAYAHYISDHKGTVSVAEDLSFGGTYTGIEPMGLLWSMRLVPGSQKGLRLRKMDVHSPMLVNISVYSGHIAEGFREQPPLASALTERWYMAPGVRRIDIREKGVRGTLFIPPGPGPFPGLMDMWGGSGGLMEYRSALLASHGYVSLALQYFSPGELKSAELEFKYFEAAFNIVKDHPQVIPDRVGIFGLSLGAIVTMYLAAESTIIKITQMMHAAGNDHLLTRVHYPDTGHLIEPPYSPHFRATKYLVDTTKAKVTLLWGGQTKPHSDAQEDSWRKILAFLQQHLYSTSSPKAKM
eukprot:superscaffoldBa00004707_g19329